MIVDLRRLDTGNQGVGGGRNDNFLGGTFRLALGDTRTLEPGDYVFTFLSYLILRAENDGQPMSGVGFGSGNGRFELSLDHKNNGNGNHVPDGGSTLAMLGMALTALGGMTRYRRD